MDDEEIEQAIYGSKLREDGVMRLLRIIAFSLSGYTGMIKDPKTKITDFYPLPLDTKVEKEKITQEDKDKMEEIFKKRDIIRKAREAKKQKSTTNGRNTNRKALNRN